MANAGPNTNGSQFFLFTVQPLCFGSTQEKLGSVSVGSSIGHRKNSRSGVLQSEVFILELITVDRLASSSVAVGEITTLAHEVGDHPVEGRSLEPESLLTGAQSTEILRGLRDNIGPQLHDNFPKRSSISSNIKETPGSHC